MLPTVPILVMTALLDLPIVEVRLFYHKLWVEGKSPIIALRESQLAIYRHPEKVADLAATRGPEFTRVIQGVSSSERPKSQKTAPTKAWAGFMLSGIGR